jgi:hypothetical protein
MIREKIDQKSEGPIYSPVAREGNPSGNRAKPGFDHRPEAIAQADLVQRIQKRPSAPQTVQLHTMMQQQSMGSIQFPVQLKKKQAQNFIDEHKLGFEADYVTVKNYVDNKTNPAQLRRGLLLAWNRKQTGQYKIDTPADLQGTSTNLTTSEDLSGWDSEDEDNVKLDSAIKTHSSGTMDLERSGKTPNKPGVHIMDFFKAIRMGRQFVKRDDYSHLPLVTDIGGHHIELDNPGTRDIYATPLDEVTMMDTGSGTDSKSSSKSKAKTASKPKSKFELSKALKKQKNKPGKSSQKIRKFKRAGQSTDFNWKRLAERLQKRNYKDPKAQLRKIFQYFLLKGKIDMDRETAEAIAAIGSDLMKGSKGGRLLLRLALRKLDKAKKNDNSIFSQMFTGNNPDYQPAATGGRALVTSTHKQILTDANFLLGVNNCLIHAVAQAAHGRQANLGEIIRVREHFANYGEMMLATPQTIDVIRQALGIQNRIRVVYPNPTPHEDFAGQAPMLVIYHVHGNHFQHNLNGVNKKKYAKK